MTTYTDNLTGSLRKAFYTDDAANRHVNPRWARDRATELGVLLRAQIRHEHATEQALAASDAFTAHPATLTSARSYLLIAPPHAVTCLHPTLRTRLDHLGGPEPGPASWNA